MSELYAYDRKVTTPFGLLGTDENALTFALGYLYQKCPEFLIKTLNRLKIKGIWKSTLNRIEIELQKHGSGELKGITDIEIILPDYFKIIIEAKTGLSIPTLNQCQQYLPRFNEKKNKLVILQNSDYKRIIKNYKKQDSGFEDKLIGLYWADLYVDALTLLSKYDKKELEGYWLRNFIKFLEGDYYMKAYTTEVWIVSTSRKELWPGGLSQYDFHTKHGKFYYYESVHQHYRPLYMAFRCNGFDSVQRVLDVIHDAKPIDYMPQMKHVRDDWARNEQTIWKLSDPIPLDRKIETGPGMHQRHVTCDFDLLLTCDTVREIEIEMGKRRK